jgi:hypothetical protein
LAAQIPRIIGLGRDGKKKHKQSKTRSDHA